MTQKDLAPRDPLAPIRHTLARARECLIARQDDEAGVLLHSANRAAAASIALLEARQAHRPDEHNHFLLRDLRAIQRVILQTRFTLMLSAPGERFHARIPPEPGKLLRIPLLATGDGTVPEGRSFDTFTPANSTLTLRSQNLPWFRYRLEGVLVQRAVTFASMLDNVVLRDLVWSGGNSTLLTQLSADTARVGNTQWIGLRAKPVITNNKHLTLNLDAFSAGNAAPGGSSLVAAMAVITVLDDLPQRDMIPTPEATFLPSIGYSDAGPPPGELLRVAFTVETTDAINAAGSPAARLSAAVPEVTLISTDVPFTEYQVVGIETVSPVRQASTDFATLRNLRGSNSIDLLGEVGDLPIEAFLLDESDRGGGSNHLVGLRKHQKIKSPGRMRITLRGWDGLTGNAGPTNTLLVNGVNLLVNNLSMPALPDDPLIAVGPTPDVLAPPQLRPLLPSYPSDHPTYPSDEG